MKKECKKCFKIKLLDCFYLHPSPTDGHSNECKECAKERCRIYQRSGKAKLYEKKREQTKKRKEWKSRYQIILRERYRGKSMARNKVSNSLRDGKLKKQPCEICGEIDSQAHHKDYRKPLEITWLCFKHHMEVHNKTTHTA